MTLYVHTQIPKNTKSPSGNAMSSRVEDYISENNPVRAIDAYVDTLDLTYLGFKHANEVAQMRGQPPYNPAALLKEPLIKS